jgi:hypothetical protein
LGEGEATIKCGLREQRIGDARNNLDRWFVRRRREEFRNGLVKKKRARE